MTSKLTPLYSICSVLIIQVCSSVADSDGNACYSNQQLSIFCSEKIFEDAKKACEGVTSYLVKIDNANMTKVVNLLIDKCEKKQDFFIGAQATHYPGFPNDGMKRKWSWLDESKVNLPKEDGYQNWQPGQPNDYGGREDCLILDKFTKQWKDSPCDGEGEENFYICQKSIVRSETTIRIENGDIPDERRCVSSADSCATHTEWLLGSEVVVNNSSHTVYQTTFLSSSILHYENATIGNAGKYICVAWVVGDEKNQKFASMDIFVNGTPAIDNIKSFTCNTSLQVAWEPQIGSLGFPHRIVAYASDGEKPKVIEVTPNESIPHFTELEGLKASTKYNVKVVACKDINNCSDEYETEKTATTYGTIAAVTKASMYQVVNATGNDTCIVTWQWLHKNFSTFKITLRSRPSKSPNVSITENFHTVYTNNYSFVLISEQVYDVEIQPILANEKYCPKIVKAVGSCFWNEHETVNEGEENEYEQPNVMMFIIPSAAAGGVILLAIVIFALWKRIKATRQPADEMTANPIYGATDYEHLHSSSKKKRVEAEEGCSTTRNEDADNVAYATAADLQNSSDAPIYATVDKTNRKAVEKEGSSGETKVTTVDEQAAEEMVVNPIYDMEPSTSTATHDQPATSEADTSAEAASTTDDPIYSAVDKVKKKKKKKSDDQNVEHD